VWRWTCVSMHEAGTRHFRPRLDSLVLLGPDPSLPNLRPGLVLRIGDPWRWERARERRHRPVMRDVSCTCTYSCSSLTFLLDQL
jgi:hypothetical protein